MEHARAEVLHGWTHTAFPIDDADIVTRTIDIDGVVAPNVAQLIWAGLAILTGMPSVAFPSGRTAEGLPIGLQLMGPHGRDRDLLRLAAAVAGPSALLA